MPLAIVIDDRELKAFQQRMTRVPRRVKRDMEDIVKEHAANVLKYVKENASGRPGPNVVTGEYQAHFFMQQFGQYDWLVGNSSPQAARLEFGFVGSDSLGRHYHQAPFPHFRPAALRAQNEMIEAVKKYIESKGLSE